MPGDGVLIRPFGSADQDAARRLILAGLAEHFGTLDASRNPDLQDIRSTYLAAGHAFLVAVVDGALVGTGALVVESATVGRIVRMSVARSYRERGLHEVRVGTEPDWHPAVALYTGCGFVEYDRDAEDIHYRLPL